MIKPMFMMMCMYSCISPPPLGTTIALFGGQDGVGPHLSDTWLFDGKRWVGNVTIGESPPPRCYHAMSTLGDRVVIMFGGISSMCSSLCVCVCVLVIGSGLMFGSHENK